MTTYTNTAEASTEPEASAIRDAIAAGYAKSPNNIHDLPGSEWYPACEGKTCLSDISTFVQIERNALPVCVYCNVYGCGKPVLIRRYRTFGDFLMACEEQSNKSQPALPPFMYGLD